MKHLLKFRNRLKKNIAGRNIFIFLDFDGTLAAIALTPEKAAITGRTWRALKSLSLSRKVRIAVISGRALGDIKKKVGLPGLIYSGNHGLEIEYNGKINCFVERKKYGKIIRRMEKKLKEKLRGIKGVVFENKGLSMSVHFRQVRAGNVAFVKKIITGAIAPFLKNNILRTGGGKKVREILPASKWGKGEIVSWLLRKTAKSFNDPLVFCFGDDRTDEEAFSVLKKDYTVFVGPPSRKSGAGYFLRNPGEVFLFLSFLAGLEDMK